MMKAGKGLLTIILIATATPPSLQGAERSLISRAWSDIYSSPYKQLLIGASVGLVCVWWRHKQAKTSPEKLITVVHGTQSNDDDQLQHMLHNMATDMLNKTPNSNNIRVSSSIYGHYKQLLISSQQLQKPIFLCTIVKSGAHIDTITSMGMFNQQPLSSMPTILNDTITSYLLQDKEVGFKILTKMG